MKTFIKIIFFVLSVAISYGQKLTVVMPYNSTEHSLSLTNVDTNVNVIITGYACGIGPVEGNQALAHARAIAVMNSLISMGFKKFSIRTILLTQRGSIGWKTTVEFDETETEKQGFSVNEYIRTQTAPKAEFSSSDQPIALEGPYSVWDGDSTSATVVTHNSSPLGTDLCSPHVDSSLLFEAMDSLEKELMEIDDLYEDENEDAVIPCDCNFPTNITPESALGWRRNVYRLRAGINTAQGNDFEESCLGPCLEQMLKLENKRFKTGHVVGKGKNLRALARKVARIRAWRKFKSRVMGCFIASRK